MTEDQELAAIQHFLHKVRDKDVRAPREAVEIHEGPIEAEEYEVMKPAKKRRTKKASKKTARRGRPAKKARKAHRKPAKKAARRGRPRTSKHYTTPMRKAHARELKTVKQGHTLAIGILKQTSQKLERLIADEEKAMSKLYRSA